MGFFDLFRKKQDTPADTAAGAAVEAQPEQRREELNAGLERTKTGLFSKLARAVAGRSTVDAEVLDDLEEVLITSDVGGRDDRQDHPPHRGARRARQVHERGRIARHPARRDRRAAEQSHASTKDFGLELPEGTPYVLMVVGVNGAGKTTTIGKLAAKLTAAGRKVYIGAADTFRAAAIDQLAVWAERAGATMIRQEMGSDPRRWLTIRSARPLRTGPTWCSSTRRGVSTTRWG